MPKKQGGRMREDKRFGIHENSVIQMLERGDPELKRKYRENRARFEADRASIESWAAAGFTARFEEIEDV